MPLLYNLHRQKNLRQSLRRNATPSERLLWYYLRGRQLGVKFRRQYGIRRWIVDFYCPELRLAIEIDGDFHFGSEQRIRRDLVRQQRLVAYGILILRFYSIDVQRNTEGVILVIEQMVAKVKATRNTPNPTTPPPPPQRPS